MLLKHKGVAGDKIVGDIMKRVVVLQGQFGFFSTAGLSLSMPAVQTCIGLYGVSHNGQFVLAAHFDTDKALRENISEIMNVSEQTAGMHLSHFNLNVFGGDGFFSYLRCSTPSLYVGESIIRELRRRGVSEIVYDPQHYSGIVACTYNLSYSAKQGFMVSAGKNEREFIGVHRDALEQARIRIKKSPAQYSNSDAMLFNISRL
jgi:hypothetical protein